MQIDELNVPVYENFDQFNGTFESLPPGFAVSKDGIILLSADDVEDFKSPHDGGTATGACRPWDLGDNDFALGYQPTADEFSPGFFLACVSNSTGKTIQRVSISYEIVCLNNENRSSSLNFEYSMDGITFLHISKLDYTSPTQEMVTASWEISIRNTELELPSSLRDKACIWIRWYGNDAGGAGSRDEYGINNFSIIFKEKKGTVIVIE